MNTKLSLALAALIGGAAVYAGPASAAPVSCSTIVNVGGFEAAADGCTVGDKLFKSTADSNLPNGTLLNISQVGLTYSLAQLLISAPGDYNFDYSVEVVPPTSGFRIVQVDIDSDLTGEDAAVAASYVTKSIYGEALNFLDTITSTAGNTDESIKFDEKKIFIDEDIHLVAGALFVSISNDIIQSVPEPAALALFGFGLLAMGATARRRR